MKTKRKFVPLEGERNNLNHYLTLSFREISDFADLKELYEENRSNEKEELYTEDSEIGRALREKVAFSDAGVAWKFFLSLSIGVKEASFYLASSFLSGYGVKENDFLMGLSVAIGVKLKDRQSMELVDEDLIPDNTKKLAEKCVETISQAAKSVKDRDITYETAIGWGLFLDKVVKDNSNESFKENILTSSMFEFAKFVELDDGNVPLAGEGSGSGSSGSRCWLSSCCTNTFAADE